MTFEVRGQHLLIPTIVGGKEYSANDALHLWQLGKNPEVGAFKTAAQADRYAKERTLEIGRQRGAANATGVTPGSP